MKNAKRWLSYLATSALVLQLFAPSIALAVTPHVTASGITVQDITRTSATVCFTLSGNGYAKIYYGQTTTYGQSFQEEAASSCGKILRLTGLSGGAAYNFKIVSWPVNGSETEDGESSPNQFFATPAGDTIVPGNVADGKANLGSAATTSATHDTVTFNWKVPGDDGWNAGPGPAAYVVKYQKRTGTLFQSPSDGGFWNAAPTLPAYRLAYAPAIAGQQMGATQTLTINGLEPNTPYRFGVLSVDASGNQSSLPGVWDLNTTAAPAADTFPPAQVTGLGMASSTATTLEITWTSPWDPGINATPQAATRYEIRYRNSPIATEADWNASLLAPATPTPKTGAQGERYTFTSLTPSTTYYIAIRAYDAPGNVSSISIPFSAMTTPIGGTTAPKLTAIRIESISKNNAWVYFTLEDEAYVKVEYFVTGGLLLSTPEQLFSGAANLQNASIFLQNLLPGTTYQYQVALRTRNNLTRTEKGFSFTTLAETATTTPTVTPSPIPTPVISPNLSNVRITNIYANSVDITTVSDQPVVLRAEYGTTVQYGTFTPWSAATTTNHTLTISGLTPDTIYNVRLQAKNDREVYANTQPTLQFKTLSTTTTPPPAPTPGGGNSTFPPGDAGLTVIVKSPEGTPLANAMIGLMPYTEPGTPAPNNHWASGTTNAQGEYPFPKIQAGVYSLGIGIPPSRVDLEPMASIKIILSSGTTVYQNVTLPKRSTPTPGPNPQEPLIIYNTAPGTPSEDGKSIWVGWMTNKSSTSRVDYGTTQSLDKFVQDSAYTTNHPIQLQNLEPNTTYYFRAMSTDANGGTATSPTYSFRTTANTRPVTFMINYQALSPLPEMRNVPIHTTQIHVEFTKPIDTASLPGGVIDMRILGDTKQINGSLQTFTNGFNYNFFEALKPNTTYTVSILGNVKDASGTTLGSNFSYTFTTVSQSYENAGTIKGTVKDGNGTTIANANVRLTNASYSFNTNINTTAFGEFHFSNLKPDTYLLYVYPPNYGEYSVYSQKPLTIALSSNETKVQDIVLTNSTFSIKGSVLFSDTKTGVIDAEVVAYRKDGPGAMSAEVNSLGEYCMIVSPGTWVLSVQPRYYQMYGSSQGQRPYRSSCQSNPVPPGPQPFNTSGSFPNTTSQMSPGSQAPFAGNWYWKQPPQEVVVTENSPSQRVIHFEVSRVNVTRVSGRVVRHDGLQFAPGSVSIRLIGPAETKPIYIQVSSFDGKFQDVIPAGTYKILVDVTDPSLTPPELPLINISEGETKDLGVITLGEAGLTIDGLVSTQDNTPLPRLKVGAWKQGASETRFATTDEQGKYILKVSEGDWMIGVIPSADQQYSMIDPPRTVRVTKKNVSNINFTLSVNNALVTGTVRSGNGAILSDFYGFISVRLKNGMQIANGAPVERGEFRLRMKQGEYLLMLETPPNALYGAIDPITVSLQSGDQKTVTFTVQEKRAILEGALVDERGVVVTGVPFKVFTASSAGSWFSADVDINTGKYKLTLTPGEWKIDYEILDTTSEYQKSLIGGTRTPLAAGETKPLNLPVQKSSATITGKAIDTAGDPVANTWIAISTQSFALFSEKSAKTINYLNGVYTGKDGTFSFKVRPGTYYVRSFLPPSLGLINPEEEKVAIGSGKTENISLVFRPVSVSISGTTTIGGKPGWAFIWAWSDTGGYTDAESGNDGKYSLKVAPDDVWHIAALAERDRNVFKGSEAILTIGTRPTITHDIDLAALNVKLPNPVTTTVESDQLAVATNIEGVKLAVPANAVNTDGTLTLSIAPEIVTPSQGASRVIGYGYDIDVRTSDGREINSFNSDLTVTVPYNPTEVATLGLKPTELSLQYWDEARYSWQPVRNAVVNEKDHTITSSIGHLTKFAIIASGKTTAAAAPVQMNTKKAKKGIVLSWAFPVKEKKNVKYVKVYRSPTKGVLGKVILNNLKKTSVTDTTTKAGKTYFYTIRSVDLFNNESVNTKQLQARF